MPSEATKYSKSWKNLPKCQGWLSVLVLKEGTERTECSLCSSDFSVAHGGFKVVKNHMNRQNGVSQL